MPILKQVDLEMFYEMHGSGPKTLLFVHGTAGDHDAFRPQLEKLASAARVVAVDLRGHGRSSCSGKLTIESFATDIEGLIRELDLKEVVIVGHSIGGLVALEVARRSQAPLAGIALLDAAILIPEAVGHALAPFDAAFRSTDLAAYRSSVRQFASQFFFAPGDSVELKEKVLGELERFPQSAFLEIWDSGGRYDAESALREARVPILYVHSSVPIDLARLGAVCPSARIEKTQGSGHFSQLLVPDQVTALISQFAASL